MRASTASKRDSIVISAWHKQRWDTYICLFVRRSLRIDRRAIIKIIVLLHVFAFITVYIVYRAMGRLTLPSIRHFSSSGLFTDDSGKVVAAGLSKDADSIYINYAGRFNKDDALRQLVQRKQQLMQLIAEAEQEKRQLLADMRALSDRLHASLTKTDVTHVNASRPLLRASVNITGSKIARQTPDIPLVNSAAPHQQIAVLVIACDRPTVRRNLDLLVKYRDNSSDPIMMRQRFPIVVSQDCGHAATAQIIDSFVQHYDNVHHIKQPDQSNVVIKDKSEAKFQGYYRICRHYKWALNQIFIPSNNYSAVIIVEDDLDVAPDFFDYFQALWGVLQSDKSLWCVSAWNDNGKPDLIEQNQPGLLHRTDFFPGLGWMMLRELWHELEPKWPEKFWDDWMRKPEQRQNRSCIRPEISRTSTFGKKGVSKGQFFDQHLKFIKLNDKPVRFAERDMRFLLKSVYDLQFNRTVYAAPAVTLQSVKSGLIANVDPHSPVRLTYRTKSDFLRLATDMGAMTDLKAGVARTAYKGVVMITYRGRRVFLAPPADWAGYEPSWS